MKLQTWFNENDYLQKFKKYGVQYRKYPELDLMIIKRSYGSNYSEKKFWLNYCRGLIINYKTNDIVFIPPVKAKECNTDEIFTKLGGSPKPLVDGTMVNLFYYKDQWLLATRSNIGAKNKWAGDKSFSDMFQECSQNLDISQLNTNRTYSFVMRHKKNRLTSKIYKNELVLVEVYDKLSRLTCLPENEGYSCIDKWIPDELFKGLTVTINKTRYKWITNEHKFIEMIKPNTNNPLLSYLKLRNSGHLTQYLRYFPEQRFEYDKYRNKLHQISKLLYQCYVSVFIQKSINKEDIPYHLKPLLYEIHGEYLNQRQGISWEYIKNYIYELEPKRLCFVMNNL